MPSRTDARAAPDEGPPPKIQRPAQATEPRSRVTVARTVDISAWRERAAWSAAAAHLNAAGLAAAVPPSLVGYMRRRGFVVWPCGDRRAA
jgi:hypothetical protein